MSTTGGQVLAACECAADFKDTPSQVTWYWAGGSAFPLLAASSWDGSVNVWEIQTNKPLTSMPAPQGQEFGPTALNAVHKGRFAVNSPVLTCCFVGNHSLVLGTLDKRVIMVKLATGEQTQIGAHDAWVRKVFVDERNQMVCSVSYDGTIRWWNGTANAAAPAHKIQFPGKLVDADLHKDILALMTEDSNLHVYSLANTQTPPKKFVIPQFQYALASLALFKDGNGVCITSAEGRARVLNFMGKPTDDFAFRCQRKDEKGNPITNSAAGPDKVYVYSVNAVDVNPIYNTLLTGGGDARITTWDKVNRFKLVTSPELPGCVNCVKYDPSGRLVALGVGYDWHLGIVGKSQHSMMPNKVFVMSLSESWIKTKPPK